MIEFKNVSKAFGDRQILKGVSLTVDAGKVLFVIGKSGAGKSVLTKHVVGLVRPDSGAVLFDGVDVSSWTEEQFYPLRKRCTMVLQHSTLFDSMTIVENVALPIRKHRQLGWNAALETATSYLNDVGMAEYAKRMPDTLGDGLRKRIAIARALALQPQCVIFDEPTTGLDPQSAIQVDGLIRSLADRFSVTCIVVSHDLRSIFSIADRVVMLYQGQVLLDGPADVFRRSEHPVVKQFMSGVPDGPMEL
ncbi:MAG: ABC transporter ATP-binding protein [Myxococcales bacterium]|nr:ABC transporter ATP-binding protein [Myxococcales bacterium]|tara:strand:+ start:345 stop:1088 length:744 start_codon:yes stop_codon:yes gene_type:complete